MFPMEFNRKMLNGLPLPNEHGVKRVLQVLQAIVMQKIGPYFRNRRGTDLIQLARVKQNLFIHRLEDEEDAIPFVLLRTRMDQGWNLMIHEHFFDYLAFLMPLKTELAIGDGTSDERKMIAFMEFILRHEMEHMLYPERGEAEVIRSDVEFAMGWREEDPTSYRFLRGVLADEMNGLKGDGYLELFDCAEQGKPYDTIVDRLVERYTSGLGALPQWALERVFPHLDTHIKTSVLGECYQAGLSPSNSLVKRASNFKRTLSLFSLSMREGRDEALQVFNAFREQWGVAYLFHELNLPEGALQDESDTVKLFDLFRSAVSEFTGKTTPSETAEPPHLQKATSVQQPKTLKDRIEEARHDPRIPPAVMELIDKNKLNASGQSGAKYSELIETLLAIPWGRLGRVGIAAEEFEEGVNRSHFGLAKPKEIVCDIFANLIWRYKHLKADDLSQWKRTGSALLFVGPPGVGKTSLAISIAKTLGVPYHKISLGGMKDEADIRGYGFTYEGSKPGPIVQGLVKMGVMNGVFILDEADKTEKFAISTLLEILDPEQNHLFHDKYTQSTVDIDLSNAHFILTANTLETVPAAVLNRCEVIFLDRYSVEEKIAIARRHLVQRVRNKYMIAPDEIFFDPEEESEILRYLIRNFTFEAGVRDLERIIRTLFLRAHRKEIMTKGRPFIRITREKLKEYLEEPPRPKHINDEDRIGEAVGLGVNMEMGVGSIIPIQVTPVKGGARKSETPRSYMSMVHATGNIEKVMDESRKVAATAILHRAEDLGIDTGKLEEPVHLHFMGGSTKKDGPSAGGAIALALASLYMNRKVRRDVAMTGEIDTQGRITSIGGLGVKLETAFDAGARTIIIPRENLQGMGGIQGLPDALKRELQILTYNEWKSFHEPFDYTRHVMQIVAVDDILQAIDVACVDEGEIDGLENQFVSHANRVTDELLSGETVPLRCMKLIYVSDPDELDPELFQPGLCKEDAGSVLLVAPDMKKTVAAKLQGLEDKVRLREFDRDRENLTGVIEEIRASAAGGGSYPLRISVIAPLNFLKRDGIRAERFASDAT
ncbi:MAG: S16 family serine protease, partial [Acidobacteriota bacterium]